MRRGWLWQLTRRTPLGWLQLRHDWGRLVVALAGIAFADLLMFLQLGFQAALYDSNTRLNRAFRRIVLLSPRALNLQNLSTFPRRRLFQALDVPGWPTLRASSSTRSPGRTPRPAATPPCRCWASIPTPRCSDYRK